MSDLITVLYRIARTGQPVPSGGSAPPDYVPYPYAPITWTRIESDYGPGIVRPRDSITTRADEQGEGAVYLAPGRYRITLPSRDTRDVTVSPGMGTVDLSSLLAGGIPPEDPQYPTLLALIETALEDTGDTQVSRVIAEGDTQVQRVADAGTERIGEVEVAITAAGTAQVERVGAAGDGQVDRLAGAGDAQIGRVEDAGDAQVARLATAGDDRIRDVETAIAAAGDTQVGRVEDEGDTQVQRVIDAGDELAITVPDPAPQPDGRVLVTRGGALQYAPDLAAAVAVAGASPALVTIYETGRRAESGSAYGRLTDSGHTWVAVPGSGGTPLLSYDPGGYLIGDHSPRANHPPDAIGMSIVDHVLPAQSQYRVGVVMDASVTVNWPRYLVVAETADGDRLMVQVGNYELGLWAVADGVVTRLASWGNHNQGDIGNAGWTEVSAWVHRAHINYSTSTRAVDTYVRGRYLGRVPLPEAFAGSPVRVGLAVSAATPIFGFWLTRG